jgi:predicted Na+-dependent transporter
MLVPLLIGLFIKARYENDPQALQPPLAQISTISLVLLLVLMFGLNIENVLALCGTGPSSRPCSSSRSRALRATW